VDPTENLLAGDARLHMGGAKTGSAIGAELKVGAEVSQGRAASAAGSEAVQAKGLVAPLRPGPVFLADRFAAGRTLGCVGWAEGSPADDALPDPGARVGLAALRAGSRAV
jgi:hypothetical protein